MKRTPIKRGKPLTASKPMRKRSPKRQTYMASAARTDGVAHMLAVKELGCLICGAPAEAHHLPHPRNDLRTIPLCPFHHRTEYGSQAYHYSRRNFNALHGSDEELLAKTMALLKR
jgi:hypothetical protein